MSRLHELFHHPDKPEISLRDLAEFLLFTHEEIMQQLQDLQAAVAAEDTVIQGAVTLIQGIAQRISDAGVDPAALQALTDDINTQANALAAAVAANTPAASSPAPAPAPGGVSSPSPAPTSAGGTSISGMNPT